MFKSYKSSMLTIGLIFLMLSSHWICTHAYAKVCAPVGVMGFLQTMIGLGSPMCGFLMQMQYKTAEYYSLLLIACGLAIINLCYSCISNNIKIK